MKNSDHNDLITRYFDDTANDAEMSELNDLLASSPEARSQFHSAIDQAIAIASLSQEMDVPKKGKVVRFPKILGMAAGLCALLMFAFIFNSSPMAKRVSSGGETELPSGEEIASGDTVKTVGAASFLNFKFKDGTKVRLAGNTIVTVTGEDQKRLVVHQGAVSLDVVKQPISTPLILITPTAELTVRGTSFGVFASEGVTQLEVSEGAVDLKRLVDGSSVRVEAGEYSVTGDLGDKFETKLIPQLTRDWSIDLRHSPEKLLNLGVAVTDLEGAIIGAEGEAGYGAKEVVAIQNAWAKGDYAYFRVEKDSVLKVRLKMENPEWLNFVMNYRSSVPGSTDVVTCVYQNPSAIKGLKPGEWCTVELPLSEPKLYGDYFGSLDGIPVGWSCFGLSVSAGDEQRGLVVEKIWTE